MFDSHCPKCGSNNVEPQTVKDRFRAADPSGEIFEVALQLLMWRCKVCKLGWQGEEAMAAKEAAYQYALVNRSPNRTVSYSGAH